MTEVNTIEETTNPACMGSFDARDWARDFVATLEKHPQIASDEGAMLGWFANAIMAGYDHGYDHAMSHVATQPEKPPC